MKLSTYIVKFDTGFAPNPFGRHCTLACCKPTIRRNAEECDVVVGIASARLPKPGRLIYAMRVKEILTYQQYWKDPRFAGRRPSSRTSISRCGDNIWHRETNGWKAAESDFHDRTHLERDTNGVNALIATEFFYFGSKAIRVPTRFRSMLATTQGHKNTYDRDRIERFWDWIANKATKPGRIADPWEFNGDACRAQCGEVEPDDIEENC
jgi:hypothetical protein